MPDTAVNVRYIVDDVAAAVDFYTALLDSTLELDASPGFATVGREGTPFRNDIVTGRGGKQILLDDPSGNPVELFQPAG